MNQAITVLETCADFFSPFSTRQKHFAHILPRIFMDEMNICSTQTRLSPSLPYFWAFIPMWNDITQTLDHIHSKIVFQPETGIILGTGLGNLVGQIEIKYELPYSSIPHFPLSTVESHSGRLIFGMLSGRKVVVMQGRFHYYEGYTMQQVTYPVRVMQLLGIKELFISNVSGSINPSFEKGDIVLIEDHINLLPENPLRGRNDESFGPRFPDMSAPYSMRLIDIACQVAEKKGYRYHKGVYASVSGPNLETKAEYRMLHRAGADIVGMSTVPEVIVAVHCGLEVFAISVVTDKNFPLSEVKKVSVEEVIAVAKNAEPKMTEIICGMLREI